MLMEAWRECQDEPSALPQWPMDYQGIGRGIGRVPVVFTTVCDISETPRLVKCAPALREAFEFLRRPPGRCATRRLEALDVCSWAG